MSEPIDNQDNSPDEPAVIDAAEVHASEPATEPATEPPLAQEVLEVDELREQLDAANDQIMRAQADLENFRKRSRRDLQDQVKYATVPVMRELVDVLDNLTRALEAAEQSSDEGLTNGVKLVADQLKGILETQDCKIIETVGQPFDPNFHESIRMVETDEYPPGTIVQEIQTGYHLHDRLIRPARVFVSANK